MTGTLQKLPLPLHSGFTRINKGEAGFTLIEHLSWQICPQEFTGVVYLTSLYVTIVLFSWPTQRYVGLFFTMFTMVSFFLFFFSLPAAYMASMSLTLLHNWSIHDIVATFLKCLPYSRTFHALIKQSRKIIADTLRNCSALLVHYICQSRLWIY